MTDLRTQYLGLTLKSPIIAGSSGLTHTIDNLKKIASQGAGAIVLKSLFEEQIQHEAQRQIRENEAHSGFGYTEAYDLIGNYARDHQLGEYLSLIRRAKEEVDIPIIASVHCYSASEWVDFAQKMEEAGADALELNVFVLPVDREKSGSDYKETYLQIIEKVKASTKLPLAIKIGSYFTDMAHWITKLSYTELDGIVMFNRFLMPDIDIEKFKLTGGARFSTDQEYYNAMRWIGILSSDVQCDLCASTGIHHGDAVIKQLLSGAKAVQMVSALYQHGFGEIEKANNRVREWMKAHDYERIDDFRGKLSMKRADDPASYTRVQFMKHFAGIE
ncbi:MAG: diguanylate cyclase [Bacteroidetes bacterium]|nr:MAG: diguanylate cyclase [Bacteroidota bacterium]PIE88393.1 MAG: diguanylate cyclase [Bacteroidota bacterium]